MISKVRLGQITALAAGLCIGVAVIAVAQGPSDGPPGPERLGTVAKTSEQQEQSLSILRRARVATDRLPPELVARLSETPFGANGALSRRAFSRGEESVFVIPANERVCLAMDEAKGATITCPPDRAVADGSSVGTTSFASQVAVYGLVPDGVDAVSVRLATGEQVASETAGNAYLVHVQGEPRSLAFEGPSGRVEAPIAAVDGPIRAAPQPLP